MTAIEYLFWLQKGAGFCASPLVPMSTERPCTEPTKSELRRWLRNRAVIINGNKLTEHDLVSFPITELVFFSKGNRKTTMG